MNFFSLFFFFIEHVIYCVGFVFLRFVFIYVALKLFARRETFIHGHGVFFNSVFNSMHRILIGYFVIKNGIKMC